MVREKKEQMRTCHSSISVSWSVGLQKGLKKCFGPRNTCLLHTPRSNHEKLTVRGVGGGGSTLFDDFPKPSDQ